MTRPVSLSISIMAVKERLPMVRRLLATLDLPTSAVAWDRTRNCFDTSIAGWRLRDPACTHHLLLQDDAFVPKDFRALALAALTAVPDDVVSFYNGRWGLSRDAFDEGYSWFTESPGTQCVTGVAMCLPTRLVDPYIEWALGPMPAKTIEDPEWLIYDDSVLKTFLKHNGHRVWFPVPSLVEHVGAGAGRSTMGSSNMTGRRPLIAGPWYVDSPQGVWGRLSQKDRAAIDWTARPHVASRRTS